MLIATRIVVTRARQLSEAQDLLSQAKDRELQSDLKAKDLKIAEVEKEAEDERLARTQLAASISWRTPDRRLIPHLAATLQRLRGSDMLLFQTSEIQSELTSLVGLVYCLAKHIGD